MICEFCGAEHTKTSWKGKWCSQNCYQNAKRATPEGRALVRAASKKYWASPKGKEVQKRKHSERYARCREELLRKSKEEYWANKEPKQCAECGADYTLGGNFCSEECRAKSNEKARCQARDRALARLEERLAKRMMALESRAKSRANAPPKLSPAELRERDVIRKRIRRSTEEYRAIAREYHLRPEVKERMRVFKAKRKAIERGRGDVEAENVNPSIVFERDGWKCGLCHRKVDSSLKYPHPESASLDHIVPLAAGGPHTYANTQLAHLSCNIAKGCRFDAIQLRMFG